MDFKKFGSLSPKSIRCQNRAHIPAISALNRKPEALTLVTIPGHMNNGIGKICTPINHQ